MRRVAPSTALASRKHAPYKSFKALEVVVIATFDHDAVRDGEIVCLDKNGCRLRSARSSSAAKQNENSL
jgi:hypothetical protein